MVGSSNTFSSALSYALEWLGTPNLTMKEEVPRGGIPRKFGYQQDLARAIATELSPSWSSTRKGNVVASSAIASQHHLLITLYFFTGSYHSSLLVNTTQFCGYGTTLIWNWRAFIIRLIPGSPPPPACWLESLGTRLILCVPLKHLTGQKINVSPTVSAQVPQSFTLSLFGIRENNSGLSL